MDGPVKRIDRATTALKDSVHLLIDATARHSRNPCTISRQDQANAYAGIMREIGVIHAQANFLGNNTGDGKAAKLDLPVPHRHSA